MNLIYPLFISLEDYNINYLKVIEPDFKDDKIK